MIDRFNFALHLYTKDQIYLYHKKTKVINILNMQSSKYKKPYAKLS
jgi:hypothetical protein